jgi:hypothetical protein
MSVEIDEGIARRVLEVVDAGLSHRPEHAPTYCGETLVCVAGVALTTPERARELLEDAA